MEANTNLSLAPKPVRVDGIVKEIVAWILVIGLFSTTLTYLYIWPYVVLSTWQIAALWVTGILFTFIPFIQKYFWALNLRYEQDLLIRVAFIVPTFISVLLLINHFVPLSVYHESHRITGTYEIIIRKKRADVSYVGLYLENNAYAGVEKIRTMHPRHVPTHPQQITYTFKMGIIGIKTVEKFLCGIKGIVPILILKSLPTYYRHNWSNIE
ncbi:hypothetical protein HUW51_21770 [Adhaeribacter swui]|uniref:Uncharacterized protein n=1 Tax=Adhaeribacter swui TaxID=2086471 RepID=A0A7G7GDI2_9BACT|nr:hypothetical protein [Adhaeribacter swui]QNF35216.1 hypothetical protein HUW51_21770 [Adhaeribacter swui]